MTIKPGGPDVAPEQVLAGGGADVVVDWMPAALAAREKGAAMVNIAQPFKHSGLELTCRADTGIKTPADLKDRTLGVWFYGNEYPFLNWMGKLGLKTDGSPGGVKVLKQGFNVDPLMQKQADCISTMTYNEYWQVIDAGYKPEQLVVFKYEDQGVATLEDGLYAMEDKLKDPAFVDKMARFVKASMKGWAWARANSDAAAKIVLDNDSTGAQTEHHQKQMMSEINKLTDRLGRQARQGRLRAHGQDAADRRLRSGHHQGAGRRLHHRRHRQGARQVRAVGLNFDENARRPSWAPRYIHGPRALVAPPPYLRRDQPVRRCVSGERQEEPVTALREIVRTCSNVHVARAALASIGGEFAERFAADASRRDLPSGVLAARMVRAFANHAADDERAVGRGGRARRRSARPRRPAPHSRPGPRRRADRSRRRGRRHAARLGDLRRPRRRLPRLASRLSTPPHPRRPRVSEGLERRGRH